MDTALIALVAGALGAGITGLLQLRRDRVETLRQRQLDAADTFAAAAARALLTVKMIVDSAPADDDAAGVERWRARSMAALDSLRDEVRDVASHAPRVELLFGVKSPTSVAAVQTTFDLTQMVNNLSPLNPEVFVWAYRLGASSAARFHDEAHQVVAASWWRRRRHRAIPDKEFDEMAAHFEAKYGTALNAGT